jgi:hypothetical protein
MALEETVVETKTDAAAATTATEKAPASTEGTKESQPAAGKDGQPDAAAKSGAEGDAAAKAVVLDPGAEEDFEEKPDGEAKPADGEAKKEGEVADPDKKAAAEPAWSDLRARAIEREMKRVEAQLAKKVVAADLPKELAKRKTALEKTLGRYNSLEDALVAGYNAQEKIRSGQAKAPLPEDATDAERAEWRKANNIPDKAENYDVPKVPGHTWTDADKPVLDGLKAEAFKNNWPQDVVSGVTTFYANLLQQAEQEQATAIAEKDNADLEARRDRRREIFGGDSKQAFTLMERALKDERVFPSQLGIAMADARMPDGTKLFNHPAFEPFLHQLALSTYGEGAMVSGEQATASASEKQELETLMNTNIDDYMNKLWKNTGMTASQRLYEINKKDAERGRGRAA